MINLILYRIAMKTSLLKADLYRYGGSLDYRTFRGTMRNTGFHFTLFFRLSYSLSKYSPLGMYCRWKYRMLSFKYGYQIPRATRIAGGLRISHYGPLLVNSKTVVGKNCYFSHNITIGETKRGKYKGSPTFGERVWIGPGAVIVGGISIGNNVLIAPLCYVNTDIPSNSIAMGNPAKIIPKEDATEGYITNIYED